jgi:hypothetical protein
MNVPRPIGFWRSSNRGDETLPNPGDLVCPDWISAKERAKLAAYLRARATYETWRGMSFCRFWCGVDSAVMGHRDFTDGVWVWPEGLHHYVDKHDVRLPADFVEHCKAQEWTIPPDAIQRIQLSHALDHSAWIAWAEKIRQSAEPSHCTRRRGRDLFAYLASLARRE